MSDSSRLDLLARILVSQDGLEVLSPRTWESLLSQARCARLQVRLAATLAACQGLSGVPAGARHHLTSALRVGDRVSISMQLEAVRIAVVLRSAGQRCLLLKGAAYLCAGLPPARGRLFGDFDILVPRQHLSAVEGSLLAAGWIARELDAYSQRYYRRWMHEIPPLSHVRRGSTIDVHHTITPPTSRFKVDGAVLMAAARPVDDAGLFWVLQPVDMVLHSAVHLFAEGEFDQGLRDLLDLDDLLRHFEQHEEAFWQRLVERACELGLGVALHHALFHRERLFGSTVPEALRLAIANMAPPWPQRRLMAWLLTLALRPVHADCASRMTGLARWLLYVRSHWLRMPMHLLVPHLARKSWIRRFPRRRPQHRAWVNPA